ncbi:MAG: RDD family protein [Zavarzinella sp.]
MTRTGTFVGTVWFAAPEQIKGETIGFDTDVYSVTATLFYLLTGQAPHQSDSLTSSMAKTLSESPASARILNPNVSKSLERVLMTGLERDRERRYGTLDELREDLEALLPERQLPARPRLRIAAYCIDLLLVALVALPIDILLELSGFKPLFRVGVFNTSWTMLIIMFSYFTVGEGWYGTTLGKILIGLRVIRHRQVEPPGIPRALARMSLFLALVFLTVNFGWLTRQLMNWTGIMIPGLPIVTALIAAVAGGIGLSIMFRKKWGFRALYDMATDCAVIIRMRLQCELRFAAHAGNWLDDLAKTLPKSSDLPSIPGVEVLARIEQPPGHPHLFLAKDITLSRRLLIELEEISADTELMVDTGPTRLRNTGRGELQWQNQRMRWLAFNAPLGAAFIDVVDPAKPLQWPQIYPLLVQLVEEIDRGRKDDSLPEHLNLAQLWLEPNGRLRIIDFVLPNKRNLQIADAENEVKLLREFITLAFEGQPRCCQQPPEAPLPLAARQVIEQIFADDIYPERLAHDLNDLRTMPRNTSTTLRAAHIGVQSLLMSMGFGLLLLIPTFFQFQQTYIAHQEYRTLQDSNNALTAMMQLPPEKAPAWVKKMPPQEIQVVMGYLEHEVDESEKLLEQQHSYMNQFERTVFEQVISELASEERPLPPISPNHLGGITESRVQDRLEAARSSNGKSLMLLQTGWALFFWPLCALVFNGGIGMWIAGVAVVNRHGLRANRMIVLVRSMLTWLPFYLVCILAMWIIVKHPELHDLRLFLLMLAPATLVAYLFLALRRPERSPVDQLFKTYIVPR